MLLEHYKAVRVGVPAITAALGMVTVGFFNIAAAALRLAASLLPS